MKVVTMIDYDTLYLRMRLLLALTVYKEVSDGLVVTAGVSLT